MSDTNYYLKEIKNHREVEKFINELEWFKNKFNITSIGIETTIRGNIEDVWRITIIKEIKEDKEDILPPELLGFLSLYNYIVIEIVYNKVEDSNGEVKLIFMKNIGVK